MGLKIPNFWHFWHKIKNVVLPLWAMYLPFSSLLITDLKFSSDPINVYGIVVYFSNCTEVFHFYSFLLSHFQVNQYLSPLFIEALFPNKEGPWYLLSMSNKVCTKVLKVLGFSIIFYFCIFSLWVPLFMLGKELFIGAISIFNWMIHGWTHKARIHCDTLRKFSFRAFHEIKFQGHSILQLP